MTVDRHHAARHQLDLLFFLDAIVSVAFGLLALITPHGWVTALTGEYNHGAHEAFRLYGCLRLAAGWIVLKVRGVDDGLFRKSVCESLCLCYLLQAMAVFRAQITDDAGRSSWINWLAIVVLLGIGGSYGRFRFGKGGDLIKVYELPTASSRSAR